MKWLHHVEGLFVREHGTRFGSVFIGIPEANSQKVPTSKDETFLQKHTVFDM